MAQRCVRETFCVTGLGSKQPVRDAFWVWRNPVVNVRYGLTIASLICSVMAGDIVVLSSVHGRGQFGGVRRR